MRITIATTQTRESETQVVATSCHETRGSTRITITTPAMTTKLAATARFQWSKATVANEATTTVNTAAFVYS